MSLDILPHEVLYHIVQFLRPADQTALRQTCRGIYSFLIDPKLQQDVAVVIQDDISRGMDVLSTSRLCVRHIVFKEAEMQKASVKSWNLFWDRIGPQLFSLSLHNCDISERIFIDVLLGCPTLRSLALNGCNSLFMSGKLLEKNFDLLRLQGSLLNLKELDLSCNQYLNDALFNRLVTVSKNLVKINLSGCQLSFHPAIYKRFYPAGSGIVASESVLTFQNVMKFIEHQREILKSVSFSKTNIDSNALQTLAKTEGLQLEEVALGSCDQLTELGFISLCIHQTCLKRLDISFCAKLPDAVVTAVCNMCTHLEVLNLRSCRTITGDSVQNIKSLKKLKCLDLSACEQVSSESIMVALGTNELKNLISLNLSACPVNEETILAIVKNFKHLRKLDLSSCKKGVTNNSMLAIYSNLKKLQTLRLAWCELLTDCAFMGNGDSDNAFKSTTNALAASTTRQNGLKVTVEELSLATHNNCQTSDQNNLLSLQGMRELDLCACIKISDLSVKSMLRFNELVYLNLSLCQKLTDEGLESIGKWNRSLETVILSQCRSISDEGVTNMVKYLSRLQYLDLQGCKHLSDLMLKSLAKSCLDLRYLDVSICLGVTQHGIEWLEHCSLPRLTTIHRRHLQS